MPATGVHPAAWPGASRPAVWPAWSNSPMASPPWRPEGRGAVPGLVEQLTGRELEVLTMQAKGMPNQAIADELFATLFTVKARQPRPEQAQRG